MANSIERKQIPNYPEYFADRKGRVWRKFYDQWRVVNPQVHHDGYQYTNVGCNGYKVLTQRLVCAAFNGPPTIELPLCIRRAKNQQPRRLGAQEHLSWGSHADKGKRRNCKRLTRLQQLRIIRLYQNGHTQISLAKKFVVTQPAISYLVNRKTNIKAKK